MVPLLVPKMFGMLLQSGGQMAGARFLKHNIRDDFDDLTDVARLYGIRAVPCFVFFIGGAQVWCHRSHCTESLMEGGLCCSECLNDI